MAEFGLADRVGLGALPRRGGATPGLLALGAFLLLYASWQAFRWIPAGQALVGDLAFLPVSGAAVYAAWRAGERCRSRPRLRQAWLLVAAACLAYFGGDTAQLIYEAALGQQAHASVAAVLYLTFYPLLMLGLIRFPAAQRIRDQAGEFALDIAIVAIGGSTVFVYVVLGPSAVASGNDVWQTVFSIACPAGDMILLVGLASVLMRGSLEQSRRALRVMAVALLAFISADLVYGYISLHGTYTGGDRIDMLWMAALALLAVAPTLQRPVSAGEPSDENERAPELVHSRLSWLPYAAVALGFGMFAVAERHASLFPHQVLGFVAIMLAALVAVRQLLVQRRLLAVQAQLRHARDELSALATSDALTGLANHRAIVDEIDLELVRARRHGRPLALLFMDVDHFKLLNDTLGHLAGDEALGEIGQVLQGCLREIDSVGRWGGEEFVALLPETDGADAFATAERIRHTVAEHRFHSAEQGLTCSIGVASYPEDAADRSKLVELADLAMYAAKRRGRNCTVGASDAKQRPDEAAGNRMHERAVHISAAAAGRLAEAESRAHYLADHDILTGLFNRGRLTRELDRQLRRAAEREQTGALLLVDIDSFKLINDSCGHREGDRLLKRAADAIRSELAATEIAARLGSDEFAVMLPAAADGEALAVADRLRAALNDRDIGPGLPCSVGVCVFGDRDNPSADDVLIGADIALFEAKEHGGDRAVIYRHQAGGALAWVDRIWTALAENRFVLFGQPIVDLRTRRVVRHELLIRMIADDGGVITPGAFLPTAERFGLVRAIDRWVADEALRLAAAGTPVSFNLSGSSIGDARILMAVHHAIVAGLDPGSILLEVTETAAMTNIDGARRFAVALTNMGCDLALDDFGTGFGSFTYLKHLPARYLKIDMEFVRDVVDNKTDKEVVQAICAIAHSLGKKTIAEGVESEAALGVLDLYGVDYAQGFFIGRPQRISAETELEARLRAETGADLAA